MIYTYYATFHDCKLKKYISSMSLSVVQIVHTHAAYIYTGTLEGISEIHDYAAVTLLLCMYIHVRMFVCSIYT